MNTRKFTKIVAGISLILGTTAQANVLGTDLQNFVPTTDGIDFVTVQSSQTLRPGYLNFGLFFNYASNTLPTLPGRGTNYSDGLFSSDLNLGVGILKDWDAGISLPSLLHQSVTDESALGGDFSRAGITEVRVNTKYRLFGDDHQGLAVIGTINFGLIEENAYTGENAGPTYNLELAYNRRFNDFDWAFNIGHRWRNPGTQIAGVPLVPIGNQWIASTAGSYLVENWDTKFILEIFGALPQSPTEEGQNQETVFEGLLGAKHDFSSSFAGQVGIGRKLVSDGIASPDFRVYIGVNYAIGALWEKESSTAAPVLEKMSDQPFAVEATPHEDEPVEPVLENDHYVAHHIGFEENSDEISGDADALLGDLANVLKASPYRKLVVEGYTDSLGSKAYNHKLSEKRAQKIKAILVNKFGIPAKTITAKGYGASHPIASNGNYQGRELNRRVEFKIIR